MRIGPSYQRAPQPLTCPAMDIQRTAQGSVAALQPARGGKQTMNPIYDFRGQVALVTGASSGMGLATARAFAEAGAAVALADINEEALRTATDELTSAGHQAIGVACDV